MISTAMPIIPALSTALRVLRLRDAMSMPLALLIAASSSVFGVLPVSIFES